MTVISDILNDSDNEKSHIENLGLSYRLPSFFLEG